MNDWIIGTDGKRISCTIKPGESDFLEMSGRGVSYIVTYGATEDGTLHLILHPVFPRLRTRPNNTHASFQCDVFATDRPVLTCNGTAVREIAQSAEYDGVLKLQTASEYLQFEHELFPAVSGEKAIFDRVRVKNTGNEPVQLELDPAIRNIGKAYGVMGIVVAECYALAHKYTGSLDPGEEYIYTVVVSGRKANERIPHTDPEAEFIHRRQEIDRLTEVLQLQTGNARLDTMFYFAKLRAGDSVFHTASGVLHSPGGHSYHAAIWCNDECEYACPWFGMTGDPLLEEAAMNAYQLYEPFMDEDYHKLPSSIIAEGYDIWDGAGDRGDAAMYLYGGALFALSCGKESYGKRLWKNLLWCAEYCRRKINQGGVVDSDSDELEGRFPAGTANLSTSCLYYGGLIYTARLAKALGEADVEKQFTQRAHKLRCAINQYFQAELHEFNTYKYYAECDKLRSWICLPLCVGIDDKMDATVNALLSPYLAADCGLVTSEEDSTLWDRSTLYAVKGIIKSGYTDRVWPMFMNYCQNRLLGAHVPYAVEAYPEGNGTQLSGESALFCRIVTEGLLDIEPRGIHEFSVTPHLPGAIPHATLRNIHAFGGTFDIAVDHGAVTVTGRDGTAIVKTTVGEHVYYTVC